MFGRVVVVHLVAGQTGDVARVLHHIARIAIDVAVAGTQADIVGLREIDLEIMKQVVAGDKVVGVRQPVRFRLAATQMALATDGDNLPCVASVFRREPDE